MSAPLIEGNTSRVYHFLSMGNKCCRSALTPEQKAGAIAVKREETMNDYIDGILNDAAPSRSQSITGSPGRVPDLTESQPYIVGDVRKNSTPSDSTRPSVTTISVSTSGQSPTVSGTSNIDESMEEELMRATKGKDFSFEGAWLLAKVVDVYDGDTLRIVFWYRREIIQYRARMNGYDSPEMRPPKSKPNRDAEIAAAKNAKEALAGRLETGLIRVHCGGFDKYGRLLITAYTRDTRDTRDGAGQAAAEPPRGQSVNEWMIKSGHGVPYSGGTKTPFGDAAELDE